MVSHMSKGQKADPLIAEIQHELRPGHFVRREDVSRLTCNLDRLEKRLQGLAKAGEAERAVRLYEVLLSGTYAKNEECDDECYLSMLFHEAFCGWIKARQAAGRPAEETVGKILNWKRNDKQSFCFEIERHVVKALDREGRRLFIRHFEEVVEKAAPKATATPAKAIFEYENDVRLPALILKEIYESLNDAKSHAVLCERLGFSPLDCERLAKMEMAREHWAKALEWVEKGVALKPTRNWRNQDSYSLEQLKPELLRKLGRRGDALAAAWADFQEDPNDLSYEELMRYVPKREKAIWQERAMAAATGAGLEAFISLCVKAKEWERLAGEVRTAKAAELEGLSHYCTEPAAKGLAKRDSPAAAKLYQALGMRILNAGKTKYYDAALDHFEKARDLYRGAGQAPEWESVVGTVRTAHSRKSGFLSAFEELVSGESQSAPGSSRRSPFFADEARERWKRLSS
jgi:tetratricopeptide (TPR) repeat protein